MFRSQRMVISCVDCICRGNKKICYTVDFSLVKRMNLCDNKVTKTTTQSTDMLITEDDVMKSINEMSKAEMEAEIAFAQNFVNNGGCMNQEQWNRVFKLMELVKEG